MKRKLLFLLAALLTSIGMWAQTASTVGDGTFFLYNVEGKAYLTGGNNWGTRASLDAHGLDCVLTASETHYDICTGNNHYLGKDGYVDKATDDGNYTKWDFVLVEGTTDTYKIKCVANNQYLKYDGSGTTCSMVDTEPTTSVGYWKLFTKNSLLSAVIGGASTESPADVSFLVDGVNFVRNSDGDYVSNPGAKTDQESGPWTYTISKNNFTFCGPYDSGQHNTGCEMWNNTFDLHQTITVPNGKYYVTCDGFGSTNTRIYAGDVENAFTITGNKEGHDFSQVLLNIGSYKEGGKSDVVTVTNQSLKVGVKRGTNSGSEWTVIDNIRLYCVGVYISEIAENFSSGSGTTAGQWYKFDVTAGKYQITSSNAATIKYSQDGSQMNIDGSYSSLVFTAGSGKIIDMTAGVLYFNSDNASTITITKLADGVDVTSSFITNPSFEDEDMTSWNLDDIFTRYNASDLENKSGNWYAGTIQTKNTKSISQNLTNLPAGSYVLQAVAKAAPHNSEEGNLNHAEISMGGNQVSVPYNFEDTYSVAYSTASDNASATISFGGKFDNRGHFYCDNFILTYYTTLPDVSISALTSQAMDASERSALTTAYANYTAENGKTVDNYNALQTAIVNAKVSIAKYPTSADADWTGLITNPSFETGTPNYYKGWTVDVSSGSSTSDEQHRYKEGGMGSKDAGSWRFFIWTENAGAATVKQTVSELPSGNYKLSAYMASGAGDVFTLSAGSTNSKVIASDGNATLVEVYFTQATQGNIEISATHSDSWFDLDNFHLTFNPTLPESITGVSGNMNSTVASAQTTAVNAYNAESGQTFANMLAAQTAMNNARASILVYNDISNLVTTYAERVQNNLDDAGQAAYDASTVEGKITNGTYATAAEAEADLKAAYIVAVKAQTTANTDMTEAITNPSFESATGVSTTIAGWTNEANKTLQTQSNTSWAKVGTYYCERWHSTGDKSIYQPITGLHSGAYILTAKAYAGDATAQVYAMVGETKYAIDVTATENYSVLFDYDGTSDLKIGFSGNMGSDASKGWLCVDDFHLIYSGASQPDLDLYTTEPMNATVKTNANTAISTYNANKTSENYTAAQTAIVAAEASIAVYETINSIMSTYATKAAALDDAGQSAYSTAINTESTGAAWKYTNGEYETSAEAEEAFHNDYVAAVKSQNTAGADMTDAVPNAACTAATGSDNWKLETALTSGQKFQLDTWAGSASGMSVPMIEYWITNGNTLTSNKIYQTITGLHTGLYTVTATTAVNNESSVAPSSGSALLFANNVTKDITSGGTETSFKGQTGTFSVIVELTDEDNGELELGLKAVSPNYNWIAMKDVHLTYLGNTSAVMAVNSTAKWGTFCAPFEVAIPGGVNAYTCSEVKDGVLTLTPVETTTISANTPVILNAESGLESTTFYGVKVANESEDLISGGLLRGNVGTEAKSVPSDGTAYLLQLINDKVGFYKVSSSDYMIGINRCYLVSEVALAREAFLLEGEGETAINEIEAVEAKAEGLKDGKYLINGRIVIVKDGKTLSISGQILK